MKYLDKKIEKRIDDKLALLNSFRPLPFSAVKKLKEQFEIEMIYNSNAIEGNSLTRDLYEYVKKNGKLFFNSRNYGIETINIQWPVFQKLQQKQASLF